LLGRHQAALCARQLQLQQQRAAFWDRLGSSAMTAEQQLHLA
jgi:hypothetical protein